MSDTITILKSLNGRLAKVWRANGEIEAYQAAYLFAVEERSVSGIESLSALLMRLAKSPSRCIIRGEWNPNAPKPNTKASTRRLNVCFEDKPRRFLALDVDWFEPLASDPVLEPAEAAREFVETMLPAEFQGAAFHLQLSNSAGAPGKEHLLKAHLWFWLDEAFTGAQLLAWQKRTQAKFDPAFFRQVQINYTADPVFDGVEDPVPLREVFVPGRPEVTLNLDVEDLAAEVRASRYDGSGAGADDVSSWLEANWTVLGSDSKGHLHIECPFEAEHGSVGSPSSTAYMPSGNGYDMGHFKCLHGHCEGRTDAEFLEALGFEPCGADDFPLLPAVRQALPMPKLERDKADRILPTANNLQAVLQRPDVLGLDIRFDQFQQHLVISEWSEYVGGEAWRRFKDADYQEILLRLERLRFKAPGRQAIRDAVDHQAEVAQIDTAMVWLDSLAWDGVPRVDRFLATFFGAEDSAYNRATSRYAWTAMAGRVFSPGCQADMVPILFGGQGAGKSSGVAAMVPSDHHRLMGFDQQQEALSRLMRGALVVELAELNGLRSKAIEGIKSWITRRYEEWVPKYKEFAVTMGRRCIFWGTTNDDEIFDDPTGERRWLPVRVGQSVDVAGIAEARDQLWAEAAVIWQAEGVAWREAEELAREEHGAYRVHDTWEGALLMWAGAEAGDSPSPAAEGFTTRDALIEGLGFTDRTIKRADEMRCAKALKSAGFELVRERRTGKLLRIWKSVTTCDDLV